MKIAIGLIKHESNSFNPELTQLEDFKIYRGNEILENKKILEYSCLGGMVEVFQKQKVEIIPLTCVIPKNLGGLISKDTYQKIKNIFLEKVESLNNEIDGICLDLHGSMTIEGGLDGEGDLLISLQKRIKKEVPVVSALDIHAMISEKMVKNASAFVGYRTAPHVDKYETGKKAAEILFQSLQNDFSLKMKAVFLPILISGEKSETEKEPMASLIKELSKTDKNPSVLASSYFMGFPWADVDFNTGCSLVVTKEDKKAAEKQAIQLAEKFWNKHKEFDFTTETYHMDQALEKAQKSNQTPVFICDCGDNPGAGGSQNMSYTLDIMIKKQLNQALLGVIADEKAYNICEQYKPGEKIELKLGQYSVNDKDPLEIEGILKTKGEYNDISVAILDIKGIEVIITNRRITLTDRDLFTQLNINFNDYNIIVLKGGYLAPELQPFARKVLFGLVPGYTHQLFTELEYNYIPRPVYPLDQNFEFNAKNYLV